MQSLTAAASGEHMDTMAVDPSALGRDEPRSTCLLIRVDTLQLVVPRILVAEVVDLEGVSFSSSPNKDIKVFEWRDYQVPLISANVLSAECTTQVHRHSKIIVFHAVLNRDRLPFYALMASTNPRLVIVSAATIEERVDQNQSAEATDVLMPVMVEGEMAAIPRVHQIEKFIHDNMPGRS